MGFSKGQDKKHKHCPKWSDQVNNYCVDEANASYKYLSKNGYNKAACEQYFQVYRQWKRELNEIKSKRGRMGLPPNPPPKGQDPYN